MSAIISPCGAYRYRLERELGDGPTVAVIMVNPSTADAVENDATIRKLLGFGTRNGWGKIIVGNLFAYRATDVRELATAADPIGPENNVHLAQALTDAERVIVAWGPASKLPRRLRGRWRTIQSLAGSRPLWTIGKTAKDGHPCHPLMLPYSLELQPWVPPL